MKVEIWSLHYLQAAQQVGEDSFPMAQLIWASSRQFSSFRLFGWSLLLLEVWVYLIVFTVMYSLGGKSLVNLVSLRLPDAVMSHLLPVIMSFLAVFYFTLEQPVGSLPVNILSCFPPRLEGFNSIGNSYTMGSVGKVEIGWKYVSNRENWGAWPEISKCSTRVLYSVVRDPHTSRTQDSWRDRF